MSHEARTPRLSRRNFLGGVGGAMLGLPFLESLAGAAVHDAPVVRLAFFYLPNGLIRRGFFPGEDDAKLPTRNADAFNNKWHAPVRDFPVGAHPLTLTPTLDSLEKMKDKIALITGMDRTYQSGTDPHAQAASCYLTSCAPYTVTESVYPLDRTLDHVAADHIGRTTPLPTLELSCNDAKDNIESIYFDNMSWYGTDYVASSMRDPREVYGRLFTTQANDRNRDITDLVLGNARTLRTKLGSDDRRRFEEYLDAIRSIETRMDRMDAMKAELLNYKVERPAEHLPRNEYLHLMGDLFVTALQAGLTNVGTMMVAPERWQTTTRYEGILDKPRSHHAMSHSPGEFMADLLKLDHFHVSVFAAMLEKMDAIREADGSTLLDNTIITLGAGIGDGTTHQYNDLPVVVAGGGGGKLKLGRHIHCAPGTPLANLWLTQLHALGVDAPRYADSTGPLPSILA